MLKRKAFFWNRSLLWHFSLQSHLIHLVHPCWLKVVISFKKKKSLTDPNFSENIFLWFWDKITIIARNIYWRGKFCNPLSLQYIYILLSDLYLWFIITVLINTLYIMWVWLPKCSFQVFFNVCIKYLRGDRGYGPCQECSNSACSYSPASRNEIRTYDISVFPAYPDSYRSHGSL